MKPFTWITDRCRCCIVEQDNVVVVKAGVQVSHLADKLGGKSVAAVLPKPPPDMTTVKSDDTIIEVAAIMARNRSPLVAVMGAKGIVGVITAPRLLEVALGSH